MRQLTILSGAGINLGISNACPEADEMLSFTYQKISTSVYAIIDPEVKAMFTPESFDYILGGLLTINLVIEKTKVDLKRFKMNEGAFAELFKQSRLQTSISSALSSIENQLTISLGQILGVIDKFRPAIDNLFENYDSINYYTVNFDGIFDHILYGKNYARSQNVTDFWWPSGVHHRHVPLFQHAVPAGIFQQRRDILSSLTQSRDVNREDVQTIVQVIAKMAVFRILF